MIPKTVTKKLYAYAYWNEYSNKVDFCANDNASMDSIGWVPLGSTEVIIPVDQIGESELYSRLNKAFDARMAKVRAEAEIEVKSIFEQKQKFLALEFTQPEGVTA